MILVVVLCAVAQQRYTILKGPKLQLLKPVREIWKYCSHKAEKNIQDWTSSRKAMLKLTSTFYQVRQEKVVGKKNSVKRGALNVFCQEAQVKPSSKSTKYSINACLNILIDQTKTHKCKIQQCCSTKIFIQNFFYMSLELNQTDSTEPYSFQKWHNK